MGRTGCRNAKIGVEHLEGRNLTTALSGQMLVTTAGTLGVSSSQLSIANNPNPEDPTEPGPRIGPVVKVGVSTGL
jgi:hypothetical protein